MSPVSALFWIDTNTITSLYIYYSLFTLQCIGFLIGVVRCDGSHAVGGTHEPWDSAPFIDRQWRALNHMKCDTNGLNLDFPLIWPVLMLGGRFERLRYQLIAMRFNVSYYSTGLESLIEDLF